MNYIYDTRDLVGQVTYNKQYFGLEPKTTFAEIESLLKIIEKLAEKDPSADTVTFNIGAEQTREFAQQFSSIYTVDFNTATITLKEGITPTEILKSYIGSLQVGPHVLLYSAVQELIQDQVAAAKNE